MKRIYLLLILIMCVCTANARHAENANDSTASRAALLAARGDAEALRPLMRDSAKFLPDDVREYCTMAIARADHDYKAMVSSIDNLIKNHADKIGLTGRISLSLLKAEALRNMGNYSGLHDFCTDEVKYYRRRRVKKSLIEPFRRLADKGRRLAGSDTRSRMLGLADRFQPFRLDSLYRNLTDSQRDSLDAYARLRCEATLWQAFPQPYAYAENAADSLMTQFADSLDADGLTMCLRSKARCLIREGRWSELSALARNTEREDLPQTAPTAHYLKLGEALAGKPQSKVEFKDGTVIPTSYGWPLRIKAKVNGHSEDDFFIDTGQAHTLLTREGAKRLGAKIIADTLQITCSAGMANASPAFIDSMRIGGVKFTNFVAYVVLDDAVLPISQYQAIGCDQLRQLPCISFKPECIVVSSADNSLAREAFPNVRLSADNTLRVLLESDTEGRHLFIFDTGCPDDQISARAFPASANGETSHTFITGKEQISIDDASTVDTRYTDFDGVLGIPFVKSAEAVTLNFKDMTLKVEGKQDYGFAPNDVSSYIGEPFFLERNLSNVHLLTLDGPQQQLADLVLEDGQWDASGTVELAQKITDEIKGNSPEEIGMKRTASGYAISALLTLGEYAKAKQLASGLLQGQDDEGKDFARSVINFYAGLPEQVKPSFETKSPIAVPYSFDADGHLSFLTTANRKEGITSVLDLDSYSVEMSEKLAKKLKLKIIGEKKGKGVRHALLDSLIVGGTVARNLYCRITPGKDLTLRLGRNWLGLAEAVKIGKSSFTFMKSQKDHLPACTAQLRFYNDWCIGAGTPEKHSVLHLTAKKSPDTASESPKTEIKIGNIELTPSDYATRSDETTPPFILAGTVRLKTLIERAGTLVMDFKGMKIYSEK